MFDQYYTPSIKGETRTTRAGKLASRKHKLYVGTPLPPQKVTLGVTENKVQLINLLCQYLKDHAHQLPKDHTIVVTSADPTPFQICQDEIVNRIDLCTTHEEADVIIVQQMVKLAVDNIRINIICDDTDVFVLLVHFYVQEKLTCDVIMSGTSSGRTVVDIKATAEKNSRIANQLLAVHVLSGCDTVSQMYGIGKGKAVQKMQSMKHPLTYLGKPNVQMNLVIKEATDFVAACYGARTVPNMSTARYNVWTSKMASKHLKSAPSLKMLPPTTEAFEQHVHRAHFQAAIWRSALEPDPPALDPTHYGWSMDSSALLHSAPLPVDVLPAPLDVLQLIKCGCSSEQPCSTARCGCFSAHLSCSIFCGCHVDNRCHNKDSVINATTIEQVNDNVNTLDDGNANSVDEDLDDTLTDDDESVDVNNF